MALQQRGSETSWDSSNTNRHKRRRRRPAVHWDIADCCPLDAGEEAAQDLREESGSCEGEVQMKGGRVQE
jgi:hypothetical protein